MRASLLKFLVLFSLFHPPLMAEEHKLPQVLGLTSEAAKELLSREYLITVSTSFAHNGKEHITWDLAKKNRSEWSVSEVIFINGRCEYIYCTLLPKTDRKQFELLLSQFSPKARWTRDNNTALGKAFAFVYVANNLGITAVYNDGETRSLTALSQTLRDMNRPGFAIYTDKYTNSSKKMNANSIGDGEK